MEEFSVTLDNGRVMKGHHWPIDDAKINFCMITGMQEHSARYDDLAKFLNGKGVEVYVIDAIGQGLNAESVELQMRWPKGGFNQNVEGIAKMCDLARKANGKKVVQAGHSMGSFLSQRRLELYPSAADATLLIGTNGGQKALMTMGFVVASMIVHSKNWDKPNPFLTSLSLGNYAKSVKDATSPLDWISYHEGNREAYANDPYCGYPATGGFWKEFLRGNKELWKKKEMKKVDTSRRIFIIAGAEDPVGQNGKGPEWLFNHYRKLGNELVTLKLYPKMRHEIVNEIGKEEVYDDIASFVLETIDAK